jgi:serine/threonine-protein kinase
VRRCFPIANAHLQPPARTHSDPGRKQGFMPTSAHDRFQRVDAAFDAVLDQPTAAQSAFIDRIAAEDPTLRGDLLQLLRAHHRSSVLDAAIAPLLNDAARDLDSSATTRVGPFRIERAIGEGGMGQVFLGVRDDGHFEQRVAIKLMRHASAGLMRRFLEERRILASLEHPRIARLIDGGITTDGLPYFAMEFIDGEAIDRYCASRHLSIDDRLALFEQVCEAVSYAHQHLVVHRDLKAGNILVDADGHVKLLDFGIAKLLDSLEGDAPVELTRTGMRVMTPEVAAPEQFRGDGVSTATDVYALGLLLYRLLTGERPYELRDRSISEVERLVCEVDPPLPSTRAGEADRRRIAGDLDLIVMTALRKQPERRYQTADALAAEVRRFREGRAILARSDTLSYRTRKFLARHRTAVAVAALAMVAIGLGVARERALRRRAEIEARTATEVQKFLVSVFEVTDPYAWEEPERGMISARALLDRGARRIDSTLTTEPEVQAELRTTLGRVYASLGLYEKAAPLLQRALDQQMRLHGASDTSVARTMDALGSTLTQLDKLDDAERLLSAALEIRRRELGTRNAATAENMTHLATLFEQRDRLAAAESLHAGALAINSAISGDSSTEAAGNMNDLALVYYRGGAFAKAESLYRRSLDVELHRLGEHHALTATTMHNLAQVLDAQGQMDEAEQYYRRSLAAKRQVLGDAHPSVTIGLNNFGVFLANSRGRLDEAESLIREAIRLDRQIFGPRHSYVAEGLRNLGAVERAQGRFVQSDSALRAAIDIDRAVLGEHNERIALIYAQLATTRYQLGDSLDAVRLTRESLSRFQSLLGPTHRNTVTLTGNLARLLVEVGKPAEAESLARSARIAMASMSSADRGQVIAMDRTLGAALTAQGRSKEALPLLEHALGEARSAFGDDSFRTAHVKLSYATALMAEGRYSEASALARSAYASLESQRKVQPRLFAQAVTLLARAKGVGSP